MSHRDVSSRRKTDGSTPRTTPISDIPEQKDDFSGVYLLKQKLLAKSKTGATYLRMTLSDATGEIEAFVWQEAEKTDSLVQKGQAVFVSGRTNIYQQKANVKVIAIRPAEKSEFDPSTLVKRPVREVSTLWASVKEAAESVSDADYGALLSEVLSDEEFVKAFKTAAGAKSIHHAYHGGLIEHTVSALRMCQHVLEVYQDLNADLLITSCILHDIGKVLEYSDTLVIERTTEGRLLGHIVLGVMMVESYIKKLPGFPQEKRQELLHVLISHHGTLEWGSPQKPMTLEAIALHYVDNLDAKINQFRALMENHKDAEFEGWTTYDKLLERYLFFGDRLKRSESLEDEEA